MSTEVSILIKAREQAVEAFDRVNGAMLKLEASAKKLFKVQNLISGAVAVGAITKYATAYEEVRRATARLENGLANIGMSYSSVREEIDKTTDALERKTNFGDHEQKAALAELIPLVGSYSKAMGALPHILDLAAFMQTDLKGATEAYAQILQGGVPRGLGKLIPALKDMVKEGRPASEVMALIESKTRGMAEVDVSPIEQMKNTLNRTAETIGEKLVPTLKTAVDLFNEMPSAIQMVMVSAPALLGILATMGPPAAVAIAGLAASITALGAAGKAWEEYKKGWNDPKIKAIDTAKTEEEITKILEEHILKRQQLMDQLDSVTNVRERKRMQDEISHEKAYLQIALDRQRIINAVPIIVPSEPAGKGTKPGKTGKTKSPLEIMADERDARQAHFNTLVEQANKFGIEMNDAESKRLDNQIENINKSIEAATKEAETMALIEQKKADAVQGMFGGLAALAGAAAQQNKAYGDLYKTFAISEAIVNTYRAANQALADPLLLGPWKIPAMIGIIGAGIANVMQISAQKFMSGTRNAPGGLSWVGEHGPELMNMPSGARVYNNTQTRSMVTNNNPTVIVLNGGGNIEKQLMQATRNKSINWRRTLGMAGISV
jgi:hypothetical protein